MQRAEPRETSTAIAASVAYATDESGSLANTGSARNFERSVSSIWPLAIGRPTRIRFTPSACTSSKVLPRDRESAALSEVFKSAYALVVRMRPVLFSLGAVALVSLAVFALNPVAPVLSLGVLYLFAVLPVAALWGLRYAVLVSIVSMLTFNWFFLPPTHTLQLKDSGNWVALAVYLVTAVSVSWLAARRRSLEREDVAKTAVLRSVSHDLRSPITAILTASEVASGDVSAAEREELLESIRAQAERLDRLVENLLDLSRLEAGAAAPELEVWPVDSLVVPRARSRRSRRRGGRRLAPGRAGRGARRRGAARACAREPARERAQGVAGRATRRRGAKRRRRVSRRRRGAGDRDGRARRDLRAVRPRLERKRLTRRGPRARDRARVPRRERRPPLARARRTAAARRSRSRCLSVKGPA